jgi:uncharacterized membrane protein YhaH (DUF805 family)
MLGFVFGFNARLGRLHYFLSTIGLAVVMTIISFTIALYAVRHSPKGSPLSFEQCGLPAIGATILFVWATMNLQAMRIRDIGWDPVVVIPAWFLVLVLDAVVATKIPAWAIGNGQHETVVGAAVNIVFFGVLLFWPSGVDGGKTPEFGRSQRSRNAKVGDKSTPAVLSPTRPAPSANTPRTEFGLRGRR